MRRRTATALLAVTLAWPLLGGAAPPVAERARPVRAEFPGKPTGPIVVNHRFGAAPTVGVPLKIEITARADGVVGGLGIEANATVPNAVLVTPPVLTAAHAGASPWELTAAPLAAEAGSSSVTVAGRLDGAPQARRVTTALRSAAGQAATGEAAAGETLIALPAQESSH
jgi:hypothetical protein